jgi:hypothetical protein
MTLRSPSRHRFHAAAGAGVVASWPCIGEHIDPLVQWLSRAASSDEKVGSVAGRLDSVRVA